MKGVTSLARWHSHQANLWTRHPPTTLRILPSLQFKVLLLPCNFSAGNHETFIIYLAFFFFKFNSISSIYSRSSAHCCNINIENFSNIWRNVAYLSVMVTNFTFVSSSPDLKKPQYFLIRIRFCEGIIIIIIPCP